ncbi:hypothetical protein [Turicibacter bilis]
MMKRCINYEMLKFSKTVLCLERGSEIKLETMQKLERIYLK